MAIGTPVNSLAGATVNAATQVLSIPIVTAGRVLVISSHARRSSTTLVPDDPTLVDGSAAPLTWTPVFSGTLPQQAGANPGTKAQWWWAISDGAAKSVTIGFANASAIFSSQMDVSIGAGVNPDFTNQTSGGNTGTGAITATLPTVPTTGINFLSFYGAGGSVSTIASGYTSLTNVASTPYRTGYKTAPVQTAVMGSSFVDQLLVLVNIVEASGAVVNPKTLNATCTSTSTVGKQVGKVLSATATSTSAVLKQVNKIVSATATSTSTVVKQARKILSATATSTSTVAAFRVFLKTLNATVTSSATLTKQARKIASATATSTSVVFKQARKILSATATSTSTVTAFRTFLKALNATVTTSATLTKSAGKIISAVATSTSTVIKQARKIVSASAITTSILNTLYIPTAGVVFVVNLFATVTSGSNMRRVVGKTINATATTTPSLIKRVNKNLSAVATSISALTASGFVALLKLGYRVLSPFQELRKIFSFRESRIISATQELRIIYAVADPRIIHARLGDDTRILA